jgi:hypothetical protein
MVSKILRASPAEAVTVEARHRVAGEVLKQL